MSLADAVNMQAAAVAHFGAHRLKDEAEGRQGPRTTDSRAGTASVTLASLFKTLSHFDAG